MNFHKAAQQFAENINLLGGEAMLPTTNPEKYNLYEGLMNLARGLEQLQAEVSLMHKRVSNLS